MPFEIVRNDITRMSVDAIVNTANPLPQVGAGTDAAIHKAAGPRLLAARRELGTIPVGSAVVTSAFDLQARYVIHAVGPVWDDGNQGEEILLRSCYDKALALAAELHCDSIAFPLISSGAYGFPKGKAIEIATAAFSDFLLRHEMQIYLAVFDRDSYLLSEELYSNVASYIDDNYVHAVLPGALRGPRENRRRQAEADCASIPSPAATYKAIPTADFQRSSIEDLLAQMDAGFTEYLLKLIDQRGCKDSAVYKKANLSKQHFSKIRNNPDYKPSKATAIALALALELDLKGTNDLIGRAGYTLSNSNRFDLIIRYFIEHRIFNIIEINLALYEFDQPLLGA